MTVDKKPMFVFAAALLVHSLPGYAIIEESGPTYTTYPLSKPSIPVLSATGSKGNDPVFGTEIMRLTDASDGRTSCVNAYSYWPVFNNNSTRIAVRCTYSSSPTGRTAFYELDPSTFTVSNYSAVPYLSTDLIWSALDPNVVFTRTGAGGGPGLYYGRVLNTYNVSTAVTALVNDFTSIIPANYGLNQMSRSMDDDIWAFTIVDDAAPTAPDNKKFVGYLVWKRSTDTVLLNQTFSSPYLGTDGLPERVDEVQIDKTGRFLTVQGSANHSQVWDLQTLTMTQLENGIDAYVHEDTGHGTVLSACAGPYAGICYRSLSRPHTAPTILPLANWTQANDHFSMLADNEGWGLVTNGHQHYEVTLPFHGEILQVATDGSGHVRRIAHTNTSAHDYPQQPFGNISRDGRFIAWTSDWGGYPGSTRTDVYLAKIDAAPNRPGPLSGPLTTLNLSPAYSDGGYALMLQQAFGTPADASAFFTRSKLRLFEDGVELAPPHAGHADIRSIGLGRFSHWVASTGPSSEALRFSATDNTNPKTNGRTYRYHVPDQQLPLNVSGATSDTGYAYLMSVSLGHLADSSAYPVQSTLRIFEDGVELASAHSSQADIRSLGAGRFSHQKSGGSEILRFSASDNSDPRSNGKIYTYLIDSRLP